MCVLAVRLAMHIYTLAIAMCLCMLVVRLLRVRLVMCVSIYTYACFKNSRVYTLVVNASCKSIINHTIFNPLVTVMYSCN